MLKRIHTDELMLGSAVRYALGRATYIVATTVNEVKRNWDELTPTTREAIRRDVATAVADAEAANNTVGMQMDHDAWVDLLKFIDAN